jgi:hypothetical protein
MVTKELSIKISGQLIQALEPFAERNRGMRRASGYLLRIMLRIAQAETRLRLIPETIDNSKTVGEPLKIPLTAEEYCYFLELAEREGGKQSPVARNLIWLGIELHKSLVGENNFLLLREEEFFKRVKWEMAFRFTRVQ